MENKNKLTAEDIKTLITENDKLKKLPSINIFGLTFDEESVIVVIISIILWSLLWYGFNIFGIISYAEYFYILYIIIL